jgi:hypothetical protein
MLNIVFVQLKLLDNETKRDGKYDVGPNTTLDRTCIMLFIDVRRWRFVFVRVARMIDAGVTI